jgi:hypothetical protein
MVENYYTVSSTLCETEVELTKVLTSDVINYVCTH